MKIYSDSIQVMRGESWTYDAQLVNNDGSPYIISNQLQNPYFCVTVATGKYTEDGRYVHHFWSKFENPAYEQAEATDTTEATSEASIMLLADDSDETTTLTEVRYMNDTPSISTSGTVFVNGAYYIVYNYDSEDIFSKYELTVLELVSGDTSYLKYHLSNGDTITAWTSDDGWSNKYYRTLYFGEIELSSTTYTWISNNSETLESMSAISGVYKWNDTLNDVGWTTGHPVMVNFTANGVEHVGMILQSSDSSSDAAQPVINYVGTSTFTQAYDGSAWTNDGRKTMDFGTNAQYLPATVYDYIVANASVVTATHTITGSITNGVLDGETSPVSGTSAVLNITPDEGYAVPTSVQIQTASETDLVQNTDYTYVDGAINILSVTEDLSITADCVVAGDQVLTINAFNCYRAGDVVEYVAEEGTTSVLFYATAGYFFNADSVVVTNATVVEATITDYTVLTVVLKKPTGKVTLDVTAFTSSQMFQLHSYYCTTPIQLQDWTDEPSMSLSDEVLADMDEHGQTEQSYAVYYVVKSDGTREYKYYLGLAGGDAPTYVTYYCPVRIVFPSTITANWVDQEYDFSFKLVAGEAVDSESLTGDVIPLKNYSFLQKFNAPSKLIVTSNISFMEENSQ